MKIGIDLGNTISRVSYLNEQGIPEVFPDFEDTAVRDTPSVVHIGCRGCLIGQSLEDLLENEPSLPVARNFKVRMGAPESCYADEEGQPYLSAELTTLLLRKLVLDAEKAASESVSQCVLSVPSWFSDSDRESLRNAAAMAGLEDVTLVDEAQAVIQHYGLHAPSQDQHILIYDLGATTFQATLVKVGLEGFETRATMHLHTGVALLDEKILEIARDNFLFAHGIDPLDDPVAAIQLRHFVESVRKSLSEPNTKTIRKGTLLRGKPLELHLSRRQIEKLAAGLMEETIRACQDCLAAASLDWNQVNTVLLSGGGAWMPCVREQLRTASGLTPSKIRLHQPDLAVAFGTAHLTAHTERDPITKRRAANKAGLSTVLDQDLVVLTLVPGTREVYPQVIIKKDSPLPAQREYRCLTSYDGQARVEFDWALQANPGGLNSQPQPLGTTVFESLAGGRKGAAMDLRVTAHPDGAIDVEVTDPATGNKETQRLEYQQRKQTAQREERREKLLNLPLNAS